MNAHSASGSRRWIRDCAHTSDASRRAQQTLTSYIEPLIDANIISGDPEMIGRMFWSAMHGTLVLQRAGALRGADADALRRQLAQTIFRGLRASRKNGT